MAERTDGTQQSERESQLTAYSWTVGDETLSEQLTQTWSVLGNPSQPQSVARWLGETLGELSNLAVLEPDWDSYGGSTVDTEAWQKALNVVLLLGKEGVAQPALALSTSGGVQMGWYRHGVELRLSIEPPDSTIEVFYREDETDAWWEGPLEADPDLFQKQLWPVSNPD